MSSDSRRSRSGDDDSAEATAEDDVDGFVGPAASVQLDRDRGRGLDSFSNRQGGCRWVHRTCVGPDHRPRLLRGFGGVDILLEFHVAAALDASGGVLGVESFDTTVGGFGRLVAWLTGFGEMAMVGVEGTGSYGAGLARQLTALARVL